MNFRLSLVSPCLALMIALEAFAQSNPSTIQSNRNRVDLTPYRPIQETLSDVREFTRLSSAKPDEFIALIQELETAIATVGNAMGTKSDDPVMRAYHLSLRLYRDSGRIWEERARSIEYRSEGKAQWRKDVRDRALLRGANADRTDLIDEIAAFEFIFDGKHTPNTLYPLTSRETTGLTGILKRYPELGSSIKGYAFVKSGAVMYLWVKAERPVSFLFPNDPPTDATAYMKSTKTPTARLAVRLAKHRRHKILVVDNGKGVFSSDEKLKVIFTDWATRRTASLEARASESAC